MAGYGIIKLYDYLKNYNKKFVTGVILLLLLASTFTQVKAADEIISGKKDSYLQVKEASFWIKENSNPNDVVISNSIPQMQYYSDRSVYYIENETELLKLKPRYYVVSIYERSAPSFYTYPEQNEDKWKGVKVYFLDQERKRPSLAIYESLMK